MIQKLLIMTKWGQMNLSIDGLSATEFVNLKSALNEAAIVAITDARGIITYANNKFCKISKYSREELVGKTHQIVNSGYHNKDFFTDLWTTISNGKTWSGEIKNKAKDESFYWVHTTIVPFLNEEGKPYQYYSIRFDITNRKLIEEQLQQYSSLLEVSNKELQDFASVAAHDLQEPLRKIQSFSDRLKIKAADSLSDENYEYVNKIQNSAQRMQTLINDLLTFSRVSTKGQNFSHVSLDKIVNEVVSDLEIHFEKNLAQVEVSKLPELDADPLQMRQLFQNLISNALKFYKPGIPPKIKIYSEYCEHNENDVVAPFYKIIVEDNGIGFDVKYLDRIFTIFQRLHGRHEYEGTGIGLSVCKKITEKHRGHITAESVLGEGSKFIVSLPKYHKSSEVIHAE